VELNERMGQAVMSTLAIACASAEGLTLSGQALRTASRLLDEKAAQGSLRRFAEPRTRHGRTKASIRFDACGAEFAAFIKTEYDHNSRIIREANIKAERNSPLCICKRGQQ
jgi:hypothetical protein